MHATTRAVQAMYEAYPYPSGAPKLRQGFDARLLLSYVDRGRTSGRPPQVLDAGCGRGVGLLGAASTQRDVEFLGIDVCERALREAQTEATRRGLNHVRFQRIDLMTLDGLDVPQGGFDVILSSGVVHHLADPLAGLTRLASVLAPHGVLSLMVYGRHGREALYRIVRAIDALAPRELPLHERLRLGRALIAAVDGPALRAGPWSDQLEISDTEFVDRYLNVHETSFDVPALFELVERAGLRFVRWVEPADWDVESLLPAGPLREHVASLPASKRYELIDALQWRPGFELVLSHRENGPRSPIDSPCDDELLAWSPEATLRVERRNLRGRQRTETLEVQVRRREPVRLAPGPLAQAVLAIEAQQEPFTMARWIAELTSRGVAPASARAAVLELVRMEVVYRPHLADA